MNIPWKKLTSKAWDLVLHVVRATAPDKTQADPPPATREPFDRWKGGAVLLLTVALAAPAHAQLAQLDSLKRELARLDSALVAVKQLAARLDSMLTVPVPPDTTPVPPPPPPPPPPAPTLPAWAQAVDRILGPVPNCATIATSTGPAREWYNAWRKWEPVRWTADSSRWDAANYYDRASIYYAMAACELPHDSTLSARYLARGHALALDYRDQYLLPNDGGASAHWSQLEGVTLHALITGDAASKRIVGRTAEVLGATAYYTKKVFGDTTHIDMENRIAQRAILAVTLAHVLQSPGKTFPATRWPGVLDTLVTLTLRAQRSDGAWAYRCKSGVCGLEFPYMDALLSDALIRADRLVRHDPRTLPVIRATVDHHLVVAVRADSTWKYNVRPSTLGGAGGSPDLNGLHPSTYDWLTAQTGDSSYVQRVAPLFLKGVRGTYYQGQKQFNQQFYNSYRYVALRQAATLPPTP